MKNLVFLLIYLILFSTVATAASTPATGPVSNIFGRDPVTGKALSIETGTDPWDLPQLDASGYIPSESLNPDITRDAELGTAADNAETDFESSTSNDFDPDRVAGDTTDDNLLDASVIDAAIARDTELPVAGVDFNAYSANSDTDSTDDITTGAGEISALTEKVSPVDGDLLVIEDSAAGNAKKKVQMSNLPTGASSWTELADIPAGFADDIDDTGLPSQIILYSDYANFGAFDTACTAGVLAYGDVDDTWSGQTATLECIFQPLPGTTYTKGASTNDITISGPMIAGPEEVLFAGFDPGEIKISASTENVYLMWFDPYNDGVTNDEAALENLAAAVTDGHHVTFPTEGDIAYTGSGGNSTDGIYTFGPRIEFANTDLKVHGQNTTITTGDSGFISVHGEVLNTYASKTITMTAGERYFDSTGEGLTLAVGNMVEIYDTAKWLTAGVIGYHYGVLATITEIDGATVYLDIAPSFDFTGTNVTVFAESKNNLVEGFNVDMSAINTANNNVGILLNHVSNSVVRNVTLTGSLDAAVAIWIEGNNNIAENYVIDNFFNQDGLDTPSGGRWGYGIELNGSNSVARKGFINDCKHNISSGSSIFNSFNVTVSDNWLWQDPALETNQTAVGSTYLLAPLLDFHANNIDGTFERNTVDSPVDSLAFIRNSKARIINNTFIQRGSGGEDLSPIIRWSESNPEYLAFDNNIVISVPGDELFSDHVYSVATGSGNTFQGITFDSSSLFTGTVGGQGFNYDPSDLEAGFETDTDGWSYTAATYGNTPTDAGRNTTEAYSGTYSFAVNGSNDGGSNCQERTLYKALDLSAAAEYILSMRVRGSNDTAEISIYEDAGVTEIITDQSAGQKWGNVSVRLTGNQASNQININNNYCDDEDTTVYIDDIKLTPIPEDGSFVTYNATSGKWEPETVTISTDIVSEGNSNVEVIDAGTGQIDFDVDGVNLLQLIETTGGTSHAFINTGSDTTRISMGAGDGGSKSPRLQFQPDGDASLPGTGLFDYGSDDIDLLSTSDPMFLLRNSNNGAFVTMLTGFRDEGVAIKANDVANDIGDTDFSTNGFIGPNMCTLSLNESTDELVIRCRESDDSINTYTISADP